MKTITTITTKGQVTIPVSVRQKLNIKVGDKVFFDKVIPQKKQAVIKLIQRDLVDKVYGSLSTKIKFTRLSIVRKKAGQALAKKYHLK